MTFSVQAIYEGGLLRPLTPLALADGDTVQLTIATPEFVKPLTTEDETTRRLKNASSIDEWVEATKLLPVDDGDYDVIKALNENRIWSGEPPIFPCQDQAS